jgi:hypothetical protein
MPVHILDRALQMLSFLMLSPLQSGHKIIGADSLVIFLVKAKDIFCRLTWPLHCTDEPDKVDYFEQRLSNPKYSASFAKTNNCEVIAYKLRLMVIAITSPF